jgi:TP901 family phage tail tape measure protein
MSNRTVSVNFVANTGPYVAGVGAATKATGALTGAATAAIAKFLGPAALVYGLSQASKASLQFQDEMTKLRTQIGLTNPEIDQMRRAALSLGGETTKAPQELAEATFFIASAGLRGAAALDVLRSSAQLSAIGLGETKTIADLLTSAVNAYGEETLTAAAASDALVSAVRLGKLEADQLAGAMGRVLPIASAMGVTFDEVGGFMAAMSKTGTDAATAATQLRAIMVSLLRPTNQSQEALNSFGLTGEGLRATIQDDGLWAALMELHEATDGNSDAFAEIFPNVRALAGVMDLLGPQLEGNAALMAEMADSAGIAEDAFEAFAVTTRAEMGRTSAEVSRAMIAIGDRTEGAVAGIARTLRLSVQAIADAAERAEDAAGFTTRVSADLVGGLRNIMNATRGLSDADRAAAMSSERMQRQLSLTTEAYGRLTLAQQADAFSKDVRMAILRGQIGVEEEITRKFLDQAVALQLATVRQTDLNGITDGWIARELAARNTTERVTGAMEDLAESLGFTREEFELLNSEIDENRRAQLALIDPVYASLRAQRDYQEALAELVRVQGDAEASSDDLVDAVLEVMLAEIERQAAMDAAGLVTDGFIGELNKTIEALGLEESAVREVIEALSDYGIGLDMIDGRVVETQHVHRQITVIEQVLGHHAGPTTVPIPGQAEFRARGGPIRPGRPYIVGEEGPELIVPDMSGQVFSASRTRQMMGRPDVAGSLVPHTSAAGAAAPSAGITIQEYNTYRSADDQALLSMLEFAQQAGRL